MYILYVTLVKESKNKNLFHQGLLITFLIFLKAEYVCMKKDNMAAFYAEFWIHNIIFIRLESKT